MNPYPLICVRLALVAFLIGGPRVGYGVNPRPPISQPGASWLSGPGVKRLNKLGTKPTACDLALDACLKTVQAQDNLIVDLKANNQKLVSALADANKSPILPTWAWVVLGVAAGVAAGSALKR